MYRDATSETLRQKRSRLHLNEVRPDMAATILSFEPKNFTAISPVHLFAAIPYQCQSQTWKHFLVKD